MSQAAADALVAEGNELFRGEKFGEAAAKFERAVVVFPQHALGWKGLGHSLLCLGKAHDAARAFDRAIGLKPDSATALWGGALAHADIGNKVVAQNYLRRTLVLQPTWIVMARDIPQLAPFLQLSTRAGELLRAILGPFSSRTYRHANAETRSVEVGRAANQPKFGQWSFVTVGLANHEWPDPRRPRVELIMASTLDSDACCQILANLAFHLGDTGFFPEPGTMVRDVVGSLSIPEVSPRLPHVYIASPRPWGFSLPLDEGPPAVTVAQVIPVSEAEYQTWRRVGALRFEESLVTRKVETSDLRRRGTESDVR